MIDAPLKLTFDDVLLEPRQSYIESRSDVNTTSPLMDLGLPIISANMDFVTETAMAQKMDSLGGLGVIHRFQDKEALKESVECVRGLVGAAIGLGTSLTHVNELHDSGCDLLVLDVAHGHMRRVTEKIGALRKACRHNIWDDMLLCAGNVATRSGARSLFEAGADVVKVGVGPGSACTTREKTGCGYPQLSAIHNCYEVSRYYKNKFIIADGGIRSSGDIVKALAAGADAVMIGGMFAGTDEAPGRVIKMRDINEHGRIYNRKVKRFRGMASSSAALENGKSLYTPEGEDGVVDYKGPVEYIVEDLEGGIRSGMSYLGAENIPKLRRVARFVRITNAGRRESDTRGIIT